MVIYIAIVLYAIHLCYTLIAFKKDSIGFKDYCNYFTFKTNYKVLINGSLVFLICIILIDQVEIGNSKIISIITKGMLTFALFYTIHGITYTMYKLFIIDKK